MRSLDSAERDEEGQEESVEAGRGQGLGVVVHGTYCALAFSFLT